MTLRNRIHLERSPRIESLEPRYACSFIEDSIPWVKEVKDKVLDRTGLKDEYEAIKKTLGPLLDPGGAVIDATTREVMRSNSSLYMSDLFYERLEPTNGLFVGADPLWYVNGVTDPADATGQAQDLANQVRRPVHLILNRIEGIAQAAVFRDREWNPPAPQPNPAAKQVTRLLYDAWRRNEQVDILGYSWGAIVVNNALKSIRSLGGAAWLHDNVAVVLAGAPLTDFQVVETARYKDLVAPNDPVAGWLGDELLSGKGKNFDFESNHSFDVAYLDLITNDYFYGRAGSFDRDVWEANNTPNSATDLGNISPQSPQVWLKRPRSIHSSSDVDWFKFTIGNATLTDRDHFSIEYDQSAGDLDLYLYAAADTTKSLRRSIGTTGAEDIGLQGLSTGTYYVKVVGTEGAIGRYLLSYRLSPDRYVEDLAEPNERYTEATNLGTYAGSEGIFIEETEQDLSIHESGDVDWFRLDLANWAAVGSTVRIDFENDDGDLDLTLFRVDDGKLVELARSVGNLDHEAVKLDYLPKGRYYVKVEGFSTAINPYSLTTHIGGGKLPADSLEPNNTRGLASVISGLDGEREVFYDAKDPTKLLTIGVEGSFVTAYHNIHSSSDVDNYKINLKSWGQQGSAVIIHGFQSKQGNLDLRLFDAGGNVLRESRTDRDFESISLAGLAPGDYFLEVTGRSGGLNWYRLGGEFHGLKSDALESTSGDAFDKATDLGRALVGTNINASLDKLTIENATDEDWYQFELRDQGASSAHLTLDYFIPAGSQGPLFSDPGDLVLELFDRDSQRVATGVGVNGSESVSLSGLPPGKYFAKVSGFVGSTNAYGFRYLIAARATSPAENTIQPLGNETSLGTSDAVGTAGNLIARDSAGIIALVIPGEATSSLRRFDAQGTPVGTSAILNGAKRVSDISMRSDGQFVAVWEDLGKVFARRYLVDGSPNGSVITVSENGVASSPANARSPRVAFSDMGVFVVSWVEGATNDTSVFYRRFNAQGAAIGGVQSPGNRASGPGASSFQNGATVAISPTGVFVIAWLDQPSPSSSISPSVRLSRFSSDGVRSVDSAKVNTLSGVTDGLRGGPDISMNAQGEFVLVWTGKRVWFRRYHPDGAPKDSFQDMVNGQTSGTFAVPRVDLSNTGEFVVFWEAAGLEPGDAANETGLFGQFFLPSGTPKTGEFRLASSAAGSQSPVGLVFLTGGDFAALWTSSTGAPGKAWMLRRFSTNMRPANIDVSSDQIRERLGGAVIGQFSVADIDAGQGHHYHVDDPRFEVSGNTLRLKDGESLNRDQNSNVQLRVTVTDSGTPPQSFHATLTFQVAANPRPWQNPVQPLDVDEDGKVFPRDALAVINLLNSSDSLLDTQNRLPFFRTGSAATFFDVNGDGACTPIDVLLIINELNRAGSSEPQHVAPSVRQGGNLVASEQLIHESESDIQKRKRLTR